MRQVPDNLVNFCNKRSLKHFRSRQQCQVLRDSRDEPDHVALRVDGRGASVEEAEELSRKATESDEELVDMFSPIKLMYMLHLYEKSRVKKNFFRLILVMHSRGKFPIRTWVTNTEIAVYTTYTRLDILSNH